ncbi:MAG: hypothetical protein ACJ76N_03380 [Thermoanaerobaculia bacterium]
MPPEEHLIEPGQQRLILRITINLDAPFGQIQRAVMRMVDLLSFGLSMTQKAERNEPLRLPDIFLQLELGSHLPLERLPTEFEVWILGNGLRDVIEALDPFLAEVWKISSALKAHAGGPGGPMSKDELIRALEGLEAGNTAFREFPVAKKLSRLLDEESSLLPREWKTALFSIINLRNCLVHRRGIVGTRDCDADGIMTVAWQETRVLIEYEDGSSELLFAGMLTKQAGTVILKRSWKETKLRLGEQIHFDTQSFADIVLTLFFGAMHMREIFLENIKALGIEIASPQQPAPASDTTE